MFAETNSLHFTKPNESTGDTDRCVHNVYAQEGRRRIGPSPYMYIRTAQDDCPSLRRIKKTCSVGGNWISSPLSVFLLIVPS